MANNAITQGRCRQRALFVLAVALLLAWCALIVGFSAGTGSQSQSLSDGAIYKLLDALQPGFAQLPPSQQAQTIAAWSFPVRKLAHFGEYLVLCGLAINALCRARRAFPQFSGLSTARICIAAVVFCALYACGDEFHQLFVSGRSGRLFDVGVDTSGAATFCLVFAAIRMFAHRRKRS